MTREDVQPFEVMTTGPFAVLRQVRVEGYCWDSELSPAPGSEKHEDIPGTSWLVEGTLGIEGLFRQYAPFSEPDLHRSLAKLAPTLQEIKHFADKYGLLGHSVLLCYLNRGSNPIQIGEPFHFWQEEIERIGALINLWDCIQHKRLAELSKYIIWHAHPRSVQIKLFHPSGKHLSSHLIVREDHLPDKEVIARWKTGTLLEPTRYFLCKQINEQLRQHVSPSILPFNEGEIFMFPDCLLSTLYVLFALEISGKLRPKVVCRGCGIYFIPKHGSQKYCTSACSKLKYYYKRKGQERIQTKKE